VAGKAAATLAAGSPGSAALSHALQRRMRHASLAEVFRVELVASTTCAARPDLAEGIRALLIDKDRRPRWRPATLAQVTPEWLEGFFASPGRRTSILLRPRRLNATPSWRMAMNPCNTKVHEGKARRITKENKRLDMNLQDAESAGNLPGVRAI